MYCLSMNKAVFDPAKGRPGCLLSLMAQGAEGCQRVLFPISVTFHVNLIYLLKHDEEKLLLWLPLDNIHAKKSTRTQTHMHTHTLILKILIFQVQRSVE